jgi:hypothetical protein
MTPPSKLKSYAFDAHSDKNILNFRDGNGRSLVEIFCRNGNLDGIRMMHLLGVDLKGPAGAESPLEMAIRWRYAPIVRFILSLKVYSHEELDELFGGTTNRALIAAVREFYPKALPSPARGWMSNFLIF